MPGSGGRKIPVVKRTVGNPRNPFKNRNISYLKSYLTIRLRTYPLNRSLLEGPCPKPYEFDLVEEPTVFIKVPNIALSQRCLSDRKILWTDPFNSSYSS